MPPRQAEARWPYTTTGRSIASTPLEPVKEWRATELIRAAAVALDADPRELPLLYERIDPDAADSLLTEQPSEPPSGARLAIEVTLDDVSVIVNDHRVIQVYPATIESPLLEANATHNHTWTDTESLFWSVGRAVATESGESTADISARLIEQFDAEAIDRLLQPHTNGSNRTGSRLHLSIDGYEIVVTPSGTITIEPSLAVLKRTGAALLLVGQVPEQGFDRATATLMADTETASSHAFVLHGRNLQTASRRISMAGLSPSDATVFDHLARARAASTATTETPDTSALTPKAVPVSDDIETLPEIVRRTIDPDGSPERGKLRLCVDSLCSMSRSSDTGTVAEAIDQLCRLVRARRGIGLFVLPADATCDMVDALHPSFDAIVELRAVSGAIEQRWQLTGTGHETSWFLLG